MQKRFPWETHQEDMEHIHSNIVSFIKLAGQETKSGGRFVNAGLAIPIDANFETLAKAINHRPLLDAIHHHTGFDDKTIDFLVDRSRHPNQFAARMLLSMAVAIGVKNNPELKEHLENNHIITGTHVPAMLVYMHKYNVTNPEVLREHIERATWYVKPLTYESQQHLRKAATNLYTTITGDKKFAAEMAKKITLNNEEQAKELFSLMSHTVHTNEEADKADMARAIFFAKNKPYMALYTAALGPTSVQAIPSSNLITALTSVMPLLSEHGTFGVYPSLSYGTTPVSSHGIAKLQGLLELSRMALKEEEVPEKHRPAVSVLRGLKEKLTEGVTYNNKTYKMKASEISPEALTAAFLVAQHNMDDLFTVWGSSTHIGKKVMAFSALQDAINSYVISPIRRYSQSLSEKPGNEEQVKLLEQYADNLTKHLHNASVSYLKDGDISGLKEISSRVGKMQKTLPGIIPEHVASEMAKQYEYTKQNVARFIQDLETDEDVPSMRDVRRNVERVLRPETKEYGKLPGFFGLGPKIGPYTGTLAGHNRTYVIDTWMYRLGTIKPKLKGVGKTPEGEEGERAQLGRTGMRFDYLPHLLSNLYSEQARNEANNALQIAFSKDNTFTKRIANTIKKTFNNLNIPSQYAPHILSSDSSNQSWAWHILRWSMAVGKPGSSADEYELASSLHRAARYMTENPEWHTVGKFTYKNKEHFTHNLPHAWKYISSVHNTLRGAGVQDYGSLYKKQTAVTPKSVVQTPHGSATEATPIQPTSQTVPS